MRELPGRTMRRTGASGFALLLAVLAGCAPPPPAAPRPAPARPLTAAEADDFATLLRLGDRRYLNLPGLAMLARSTSPRVRARTALVVGQLSPESAPPLLTTLLSDPDTAVAATAAFALGQIADSTTVPLLAARLDSATVRRAPTVAAEAAYALGKIHSPAAIASLRHFLSTTALDDVAASAPVGSALLAVWRGERLEDLSPVTRWMAARGADLRWKAVYALVRRAEARVVPLVLPMLDDPDPRVRALALRALTAPRADSAGVGATSVLPRVFAALGDSAYSVRVNAAYALGSYHAPAAVRALRGTLASGQPQLTFAALESLQRLGSDARAATDDLAAMAGDAGAPVALRALALTALASIDSARALPLAGRFAAEPQWELRAAAADAFAHLLGPESPPVRTALDDPDARVRNATLGSLLGLAGDSLQPLRPVLISRLGDPDVITRATALTALAKLADPADLSLLLDAYAAAQRDTMDDAALAAVDALGELPGNAAANAFFTRFPRSPDYLVRMRAEDAFGSAATAAWGPPLPIETGRSKEDYRRLVERWIAPAFAGEPAPEVELRTDSGVMRFALFAADAPLTVQNLVELAERGYFDGQRWPRVVPNFVIQGGDPRGDTSGGPGYSIRDELNRHLYGTGTLGMALAGPDTGGSQFFATLSPQPHLDGIYTVFGQMVEGEGVARRVLPGERILSIRLIR